MRRTSQSEKYLIFTRKRKGHVCEHTYIVCLIVAWEGISAQYADDLYGYLTQNLNNFGFSTRRRCGMNERYVKMKDFFYFVRISIFMILDYICVQ